MAWQIMMNVWAVCACVGQHFAFNPRLRQHLNRTWEHHRRLLKHSDGAYSAENHVARRKHDHLNQLSSRLILIDYNFIPWFLSLFARTHAQSRSQRHQMMMKKKKEKKSDEEIPIEPKRTGGNSRSRCCILIKARVCRFQGFPNKNSKFNSFTMIVRDSGRATSKQHRVTANRIK